MSLDLRLTILCVFLAVVASVAWGETQQRVPRGPGLLSWVPLTSDLTDVRGAQDASFTRATASVCSSDSGATVADLSSGEECQSTTEGTRVSMAVTNRAVNSEAVNLWVKVGATVTADYDDAPDGSATADRVQGSSGNYVRDGTTGTQCAAGAPITISMWMKSLTTACDIWIGNAYGSGFPAIIELVSVGTDWTRVWTYKIADGSGNCRPLVYWYNASATCTDILVWGAQLEESAHEAPGPYCPTGAGEATCNAETLTLDPARVRPWRGSMEATVTTGDISSGDLTGDIYLWEMDASSTWAVIYDESEGKISMTAGGETVTVAQVLSSWTSYVVHVAWQEGFPLLLSVDGGSVSASGGTYATPTWTGDLYLGSSDTGTGQGLLYFSDVMITSNYR